MNQSINMVAGVSIMDEHLWNLGGPVREKSRWRHGLLGWRWPSTVRACDWRPSTRIIDCRRGHVIRTIRLRDSIRCMMPSFEPCLPYDEACPCPRLPTWPATQPGGCSHRQSAAVFPSTCHAVCYSKQRHADALLASLCTVLDAALVHDGAAADPGNQCPPVLQSETLGIPAFRPLNTYSSSMDPAII